MTKRMPLDNLEKIAVNREYSTDTEFFDIADIVLVDYLAFAQTQRYWSFNFDHKGKENHVTAFSRDQFDTILGMLLMEAQNGRPHVPKDVTFGQRYGLGIDEVLISAYYADVMELGTHRPKAITISSTTDFDLGKELVMVDKAKEMYNEKAERTGKDPLELLFADNKIVIRPADMFKDNMPRYNLNLKYLVEAAKLIRA